MKIQQKPSETHPRRFSVAGDECRWSHRVIFPAADPEIHTEMGWSGRRCFKSAYDFMPCVAGDKEIYFSDNHIDPAKRKI